MSRLLETTERVEHWELERIEYWELEKDKIRDIKILGTGLHAYRN